MEINGSFVSLSTTTKDQWPEQQVTDAVPLRELTYACTCVRVFVFPHSLPLTDLPGPLTDFIPFFSHSALLLFSSTHCKTKRTSCRFRHTRARTTTAFWKRTISSRISLRADESIRRWPAKWPGVLRLKSNTTRRPGVLCSTTWRYGYVSISALLCQGWDYGISCILVHVFAVSSN